MADFSEAREGSRAHLSLEEREMRYSALLDSALDCIIWTDQRGQIEEFNAAAERTFRVARRDVLGKDLSDTILPPALRPHLRSELFTSVASSGIELVGHRLEAKVLRADGEEFPAELTVSTASIKGVSTFIVCVRDITARRLAEQALLRLAAIVESSQDAIIGTDLDHKITDWNKGAEEMYGYAATEVQGKDISIIAPPDKVEETIRIRDEMKNGNPLQNYETARIARDGRRLNVSVSVSPLFDVDGRLVGVSAIDRDITVQKQTQDALRRANDTSIYASPMPIIAVDRERRVIMWNPAAEAVFGWKKDEVLGKPNPITLRGGTEQSVALHKRALAGETLTGIELHGRKRDGTFVAISLSAAPLFDSQQKIRGIIGFLADITEIRHAEEALRRAEQKYRTIFENAIEGIYQITPHGRYLSANPAMARMLGFDSPAELIAARTDSRNQGYVNPEMHEEFISLLRRNGIVQNFEHQTYRKDGKVIWVSENAQCVKDVTGRILHFEGSVQDITERRELEQQLRLMQKIEAVGRLAGGVAHDFNNLLMAISSYSELLQVRTPESDPSRKYLEEIVRVVDRGAALTRGLLTFSRKQVLAPQILDLNVLIADQLKMLRRLVPENIELTFTAGQNLGRLKADANQIEQVVMNLVINARDAMPDGGHILIETDNSDPDSDRPKQNLKSSQHLMIRVRDDGCGMDAATQAQIFEPFFTTKGSGKGTGLGLAIISDIVKQCGGQISVESKVGAGTAFRIYLPRVDAAFHPRLEEQQASPIRASETILLVEDENTLRESIADYLAQMGYTVLKANSGPEALELSSEFESSIDLMLTDVIMPQMSGRELADKMKEFHPQIKIVFMSGYSDNLLSNRQTLDPRHILLQKPIRLSILGNRLREVLDRDKAAANHG